VATVAQQALLRPLEDRYDGAELAVRYVSASDGALIGGDVYDAEVTPWGLRVLVADVCGHGLEAVDKASSLVFAFREAAHLRPTVAELSGALESSFQRVTAGRPDFASGILLQITGNHIEVANCGHPDPILVNAGRLEWLTPSKRSRPFGLGPDPRTTTRKFLGDDRLLVYTDGLIEARDANGQFFDTGTQVVAAFGASSLDDALDALLLQLRRHTGDALRDDVVLLALRAL
jgi:serine phosphatase RsbU (regulator of sigma subunit)